MKVIVVYASAGAGHLKSAQALYNCLKLHQPQFETILVDILEVSSWSYRFLYKFGYGFLIRHLPFIWQFLFYLTSLRFQNNFIRKITAFVNYLNTRGFRKFLIRHNPDYILSTHFLSSQTAADLKRSKIISSKLATIITDFAVHPFWVCAGTDIYIVASAYSKRQLKSLGVEEARIYDLGIPIDEKFFKRHQRDELCQRLKLKNTFTVLLMTGSFGLGPLEKIAYTLAGEVQVLIVCATNRQLFYRLKRKNLANIKPYGFISNADELMFVSDVIVTKPGGLSISESLASGLLPIFISPIPGQETENIKALAEYGIGVYAKNIASIRDIVLDLKNNPANLLKSKDMIASFKKPDCLKNICDVIR